MQRYAFDDKHAFVAKLEELVKSGVPKKNIEILTPYYVHEAAHLLDASQSGVRFFTGLGAITGCITGYVFTSYTVFSWPLITGGKPFISVPAFTVIAYELTILFGCLFGFLGFVFLARLPFVRGMFTTENEFSRQFEIHVSEGKS